MLSYSFGTIQKLADGTAHTATRRPAMNILACESCGVLLDKDVLVFPELVYNNDYELVQDNTFTYFVDNTWTTSVPCPVCNGPVMNR